MYKPHESFTPPANVNDKLWRYMDLSKLVRILSTSSLYHTSITNFDDPFEGVIPRNSLSTWEKELRKLEHDYDTTFGDDIFRSLDHSEATRNNTYANCWHLSEIESDAMWKLYLKSGEGIAIQTTFKRLRDSIIDDKDIFAGKINYIDFDKDVIHYGNLMNSALIKRKCFEHEKEFRTIYSPLKFEGPDENGIYRHISKPSHHGFEIKINVNCLIENIYVSPTCQKWFVDVVSDILNKYGVELEPVQSMIYDRSM